MNLKKIFNKKYYCQWLLILLCCVLCSIFYRIFIFNAGDINQDNYYYISLGMLARYCDIPNIVDAFTVGIVPVAIFRGVAWFSRATENYFEISLITSKSIIIFTILYYSIASIFYNKLNKNTASKIIFLLLLFLPLKISSDIASLNAEYIGIFLIILIYGVLNCKINNFTKIATFIALSIICINTKMQSLPLLFSIVVVSKVSKKEIVFYITTLLALVFLNEYFLYTQKLGYLYNSKDIFGYVSYNGSKNPLRIFAFIEKAFLLFPVLFIAIAIDISQKYKIGAKKDWKFLFLLLMAFGVAIAPFRFFDHHLFYLLVPLHYFIVNYNEDSYISSTTVISVEGKYRILLDYKKIILFTLVLWTIGYEAKFFLRYFKGIPTLSPLVYPYRDDFVSEFKKHLQLSKRARLFVNGWDYSYYPYLSICPAKDDYANLQGGKINQEDFYNRIFEGVYDYIIDINKYSGFSNEKYSFRKNKELAEQVSRKYVKIIAREEIDVFEIK